MEATLQYSYSMVPQIVYWRFPFATSPETDTYALDQSGLGYRQSLQRNISLHGYLSMFTC